MKNLTKNNILGLDVATHTGWATLTASGEWDFTPKRDESKGMRLIRFKAKLKEICDAEDIKVITYERVSGFHKNALIVAGELTGVLKLFCEERGIEYRAYSAAEIKKFASKSGKASKADMVRLAKEKYEMEGNSDNQADALHLIYLTIHDLNL